MEENIVPLPTESADRSDQNGDSNDSNNETISNSGAPLKSMLGNGIEVERRLKKELLDLGILDAADFPQVSRLVVHCHLIK